MNNLHQSEEAKRASRMAAGFGQVLAAVNQANARVAKAEANRKAGKK